MLTTSTQAKSDKCAPWPPATYSHTHDILTSVITNKDYSCFSILICFLFIRRIQFHKQKPLTYYDGIIFKLPNCKKTNTKMRLHNVFFLAYWYLFSYLFFRGNLKPGVANVWVVLRFSTSFLLILKCNTFLFVCFYHDQTLWTCLFGW